MVGASKVLFSLEPMHSIPILSCSFGEKLPKLRDKIRNGMHGFEAIGKAWFVYCVNVLIGLVLQGTLVLKLVQTTILSEVSIFYLIIPWIQKCVFVLNTTCNWMLMCYHAHTLILLTMFYFWVVAYGYHLNSLSLSNYTKIICLTNHQMIQPIENE